MSSKQPCQVKAWSPAHGKTERWWSLLGCLGHWGCALEEDSGPQPSSSSHLLHPDHKASTSSASGSLHDVLPGHRPKATQPWAATSNTTSQNEPILSWFSQVCDTVRGNWRTHSVFHFSIFNLCNWVFGPKLLPLFKFHHICVNWLFPGLLISFWIIILLWYIYCFQLEM